MYGRVLNTITPETETTCTYFWSLMSNYKLREQSLTTQLREASAKVFAEDQAVVERSSTHWNRTQPAPCGTLISMPVQ